jgi:hypothetical protein
MKENAATFPDRPSEFSALYRYRAGNPAQAASSLCHAGRKEEKMTQCKPQWYRHPALALAFAGLIGSPLPPADAAPRGTWVTTGSLHVAREGQTATLLPSNGQVVVAGGETSNAVTASTEVYDPTTGKWRVSGNLNQARGSAGAVLLKSHVILIAGGCTGN